MLTRHIRPTSANDPPDRDEDHDRGISRGQLRAVFHPSRGDVAVANQQVGIQHRLDLREVVIVFRKTPMIRSGVRRYSHMRMVMDREVVHFGYSGIG